LNLDTKNIDWQLIQQVVFFLFGFVTIGGAMYVLITKNVLYAIFGLLLTFLGVAGLYVFAGADFLAVTQIMIYVGGILVLLIFGIMLSGTPTVDKKNEQKITGKANEILVGQRNQFWAICLAICIFLIFLKIIIQTNFNIINKELPHETTVNKIGIGLMTDYIFPFEAIGILLLIALIGATYIAKKETSNK
jgi:NADH-quinone oxidoreductase subunit J